VNLRESKEGALLEKGWCLLGKIHGVGKHMSGESFVSNLSESCETKKRIFLVKSKAKGWFSFGG